jgi:hypothetical protein
LKKQSFAATRYRLSKNQNDIALWQLKLLKKRTKISAISSIS